MPRGRPRKTDLNEALNAITIAFWQNGFSGTSMTDLSEASGMAKPGLYAAFGDKEAIFEKALVHYFDTYGVPIFSRMLEARQHVLEDFREALHAVADLVLNNKTPAGCFLVNAMVDSTYGPVSHQEVVKGLRDRRNEGIRERLTKALARAEITADADIHRAVIFLGGQFSALAVLGRSGVAREELTTFIETGLQSLPLSDQSQTFGGGGNVRLTVATSPR